ncbi:MAG: stage III sporulation protein AE [Eubacteriales bacterium]|nr:stage III sporulation protein AE [Eubacteriales bacterium]
MEYQDSATAIWDEISDEEVQSMLDQILGDQSFSFTEYISQLLQGKSPVSVQEMGQEIWSGLLHNLQQQRSFYLYLILIVLIGAVLSNFSKLLQGKQVAETAFYGVYLLLFSIFATAFTQITTMAEQTLVQLLDFVKVLAPAYFISMTFSQGAGVTSAYYEFTLVMVTVVDLILIRMMLPAVNLYFLLQLVNQLSEEEMFTKMAELIRDLVKLAMKTIFGIMMGINVIQGLIVPVASQVERSALVKVSTAIPGVGNTIGSVTSAVLCAGKLVKNAVGVAGVIAVFLICAIPLLRLLVYRVCYQLIAAVIQPVSDGRVIRCFGAMTESVRLLVQIVAMGAMLFILSIVVASSMT